MCPSTRVVRVGDDRPRAPYGPPHGGSAEPHLVQLYRRRAFLEASVAAWVAPALRRGGGAVLLGRPAAGPGIRAALRRHGLAPEALRSSGRLVLVDAEAARSAYAPASGLDLAGLTAHLDAAFARARGDDSRREVRAWGELVDLLCATGHPDWAMALEEAWNDLLSRGGARLLCTYRADPYDPGLYAARLRVYAHGHGRMLPMEDEARFEAAVGSAMHAVCGEHTVGIGAAMAGRPVDGLDLPMPRSQRLLAGLHQVLPDYGRRVLAAARAYERQRAPRPSRALTSPGWT